MPGKPIDEAREYRRRRTSHDKNTIGFDFKGINCRGVLQYVPTRYSRQGWKGIRLETMINLLSDSIGYWIKGGWLLIPIALVCYLIWYYFIQLNQSLKRKLDMPEIVQHEIEEELSLRKKWGALKKVSAGQAYYFWKIIVYAIEKIEQGCKPENVFEEVWQKEVTPYNRTLVILQALVAAAPLLGLLGTVLGMIGTFDAIAERSSQTTELMASGVSQAMITTQFGLIVAIPGLFGINVLKKRMEQLQHHLLALQIHVSLALKRS